MGTGQRTAPSPARSPLSTILPPLILGSATFNTQYNPDPTALPIPSLILKALQTGIRAFDTSPYYGPSERLLGEALASSLIRSQHPRESYYLLTKVGRTSGNEFDYSPRWIRKSVRRSLSRFETGYLDVVYVHDVEFKELDDVIVAVEELRRIRDQGWKWLMHDAEDGEDEDGDGGGSGEDDSGYSSKSENGLNVGASSPHVEMGAHPPVRYIGISGYPLDVLVRCAIEIRLRTGEPLDIVQTYANYTLLNTSLHNRSVQNRNENNLESLSNSLSPLELLVSPSHGAVSVVTNASILALGLLRSDGLPATAEEWHPAPLGMRNQVRMVNQKLGLKQQQRHSGLPAWSDQASHDGTPEAYGPTGLVSDSIVSLQDLSLWFSFFSFGACVEEASANVLSGREAGGKGQDALGVSVIGVSSVEELECTAAIWNDALQSARNWIRNQISASTDKSGCVNSASWSLGLASPSDTARGSHSEQRHGSLAVDLDSLPNRVRMFLATSLEEKQKLAQELRDEEFGEWKDVCWESPPAEYWSFKKKAK